MIKSTKIAISLPFDMLSVVERERKESGETRSEFFRHAIVELLKKRREQESIENYVEAYKRDPETREEIETARRSAGNILAKEPW
jgi:metal-responsive CopG/Arc/MetJ family transcriptional regulator